MIKVCFVCHGNICRSPMAEFILKKIVKDKKMIDNFDIFSRAVSLEEIGNDIYSPAKNSLKKHGIPFYEREAKLITYDELMSSNYVFVMDQSNLFLLKRLFPDCSFENVHMLLPYNVSDPWYTGDFEATYNDLNLGISNFLRKLQIIE